MRAIAYGGRSCLRRSCPHQARNTSHATLRVPNLEGKVKVLELLEDNSNTPIFAFTGNLDLIQGVEKIILQDYEGEICEEKLELRCEEICFKLASARETSLKTFVIFG